MYQGFLREKRVFKQLSSTTLKDSAFPIIPKSPIGLASQTQCHKYQQQVTSSSREELSRFITSPLYTSCKQEAKVKEVYQL